MKNSTIEKCWDRYQLIATMLCALRCEVEELHEEIYKIWIKSEDYSVEEEESAEQDKLTEEMEITLGEWENLFDLLVELNKPF